VLAYLAKAQQPIWRRRLQQAYERPTYQEAKVQLMQLHQELSVLNQSAAASLNEGLEETLSLHELGVFPLLGQSFKTTNCLESLNALIEERCGHVDRWKNSNQKHRWLAAALMDIERRLRRIQGYRHLPKPRMALMKALRIEPPEGNGLMINLSSHGEFQLRMGHLRYWCRNERSIQCAPLASA